jgi:DNA-binding CsgD family transcriptional regulator
MPQSGGGQPGRPGARSGRTRAARKSRRGGMAISCGREPNRPASLSVLEVVLTRANPIVRRRGKPSGPVRRSKALYAQKPQSATDDTLTPYPSLRKTGIRLMGDMPWGTHICVFYQTEEDLLDIAVSYFEAGLKNNEFCLWAISDPITETDAKNALRLALPDLDQRLAAGQIELLQATEWYLKDDQFDLKRISGGWSEKLHEALAKGYDGMRISGNAFWKATNHWKDFCQYEEELDRSLADQKLIALCTYSLQASRAVDILDVARAHQFSIARRNGNWEFLETPELKQANLEIKRLSGALDILSRPFSGHTRLTPRERVTLAQIVRGASNKEAARILGISPRTVEFHRANIMQKLGAKNTADLVRKLLDQ